MTKQINDVYIGRINNGAHYLFVADVVQRAEANATIMASCPEQVAALRAAVNNQNVCLAVSTKSFHTDKIVEGDQKRGVYYGGYRKVVKGYLSIPDDQMANAALILDQHMTDFGIDPQMQVDRETGLFINFLEDLEGKYAEYVALLGLEKFVEGMKAANEMVRTNKVERREERAAINTGTMKNARKVSEDAYYLLVMFVNARALLEPNADYDAFIDYVNALIAEYKRNVIGVSTDSSSAGNNGTSTTPDSTPDDSGGDSDTPTDPTPDTGDDSTSGGSTPDSGDDSGGTDDDSEVVG